VFCFALQLVAIHKDQTKAFRFDEYLLQQYFFKQNYYSKITYTVRKWLIQTRRLGISHTGEPKKTGDFV